MGFEELLGVNPWTAAFTLANTVALFLVMKKFLFKPVLKMITDRQQEIDGMYDDAQKASENAKAMEAEYREKLAQAAQTGERMVREATARGQARQEEILRQANADAQAIISKAEADIAREKKKALNDAKNELADLALDIAGKVVGHSLTEADQAVLVEKFIEELGDGK
ncbi:MAG: F0F1 ATP synthase subunit B [Oscillospiraceae bacterium]|nr:F0F1 ATP synthase subunit B [Oscillospiraceae bacterium]